jgi:hypothetical protein
MSADNYIVVDHDGDVFQIYNGSMSCKVEDKDYEPTLMDTADTAHEVDAIIDDYGYVEYGIEWTDRANFVAHSSSGDTRILKRIDLADAAAEKAIEKLDELNTKVVNLANKMDEHMKAPDAHNPAFMYKDKK